MRTRSRVAAGVGALALAVALTVGALAGVIVLRRARRVPAPVGGR